MYQKIPTLCSDCIKSNNKNDLISNYYSILISNNIQKQKRLITINQCTHFIQCPIIRNSAKTVHLHINKLGKILLIFTWLELFRNSRPGVFCKKCVLRNFAKFTGNHLCQGLFFSKVAGLRVLTPSCEQNCEPFTRIFKTLRGVE